MAGIDWVTANHIKPAVINMSIQGSLDDVVTEAMRGAVAAGITVVGAAGNDGGDGCLGLIGGVPRPSVLPRLTPATGARRTPTTARVWTCSRQAPPSHLRTGAAIPPQPH